jgi:hypothetical protein
MKLSEFKSHLNGITELNFHLPDGTLVPRHFHVTEVGQINKDFIDCGGTVRHEKSVNFQLWEAGDVDHRLAPKKLNDIIRLSEDKLGIEDGEIEVEYQGQTISKYGLKYEGGSFVLTNTQTNCLAPDKCGIPVEKTRLPLSALNTSKNSCAPGSGCCS